VKHLRLLSLGLIAVLTSCGCAPAQDKTLYEKESPYNTIVVTEDDRGLRTLWFERNGVRQSVVDPDDPDHLELPYLKAMLVGMALVEEPQRILVIGLGGGTLPRFIHKHYPKTTIDVVDIDPDVVEVAKRFFAFREDATLRAHVADGRRFIEDTRVRYDVIFLDAFGSENIPYDLATQEFLDAVRRALGPKGIVVGNIWCRASNPLHDSMVRTYQEVFDEMYFLDVEGAGNEILIGLPRPGRITRDGLAEKAGTLGREKQFGFDMARPVRYGFQHLVEKGPASWVLRDKKTE
jgi:spermidine synthase